MRRRLAVLALTLACTDTDVVQPPPPLRLDPPFVRAREAIDSLNTALFDLWRLGETATLAFYVDSAGLVFLTIRQP